MTETTLEMMSEKMADHLSADAPCRFVLSSCSIGQFASFNLTELSQDDPLPIDATFDCNATDDDGNHHALYVLRGAAFPEQVAIWHIYLRGRLVGQKQREKSSSKS